MNQSTLTTYRSDLAVRTQELPISIDNYIDNYLIDIN